MCMAPKNAAWPLLTAQLRLNTFSREFQAMPLRMNSSQIALHTEKTMPMRSSMIGPPGGTMRARSDRSGRKRNTHASRLPELISTEGIVHMTVAEVKCPETNQFVAPRKRDQPAYNTRYTPRGTTKLSGHVRQSSPT